MTNRQRERDKFLSLMEKYGVLYHVVLYDMIRSFGDAVKKNVQLDEFSKEHEMSPKKLTNLMRRVLNKKDLVFLRKFKKELKKLNSPQRRNKEV